MLYVGTVALVLIGLSFNAGGSHLTERGRQVKALSQAKSLGLALKLFAGDNDGHYPGQGVPLLMQDAPANSNAALACLFPTYVQSEALFGNPRSAYQTREPDNRFDDPYTGRPVKTLEPGENVYGYTAGLSDEDQPTLPLLFDGTDGTGHYVTDPKKRGGVWGGKVAVVIRLDNSGVLEKLVGPDHARFVPRASNDLTHNLLDVTSPNKNFRRLDPAVAPGH